jgi:hypothetical protein
MASKLTKEEAKKAKADALALGKKAEALEKKEGREFQRRLGGIQQIDARGSRQDQRRQRQAKGARYA